jgi:hypothetical protein
MGRSTKSIEIARVEILSRLHSPIAKHLRGSMGLNLAKALRIDQKMLSREWRFTPPELAGEATDPTNHSARTAEPTSAGIADTDRADSRQGSLAGQTAGLSD